MIRFHSIVAAKDSMLGSSVLVTSLKDKVVACAPRENAVYTLTWKNGMGKK